MAALTFYVDPSGGADTNGGSSTSVKASGTSGSTNSTATVDLSGDTPDLSSVNVGDSIRLSAETGGRGAAASSDIFEITAVDDGADTVDVTPTPGTNSGQTWAIGGAWANTQKAADTAIAGDEVRLMNTATETPSATIDFDTNAGTTASTIQFVGADASGDPLTSGHYTISGSGLGASTSLAIATVSYLAFERVRFTAATDKNFETTDESLNFRSCRFDGASDDGVYSTGTIGEIRFMECEFDGNSGWGLGLNASSRGPFAIVGGSIHDNTSGGAHVGEADENTGLWGVEVYDNGGDGIHVDASGTVWGCTVHGNGGDGLQLTNLKNAGVVVNTSFVSNGGYGINLTGSDDATIALIDYNHFHSNTSGQTNGFGGTPGSNNQTGDPQFASVADGSEDFTPDNGSPLDSNGLNGVDIGARKATDPAGGGGTTVPQGIHPIEAGITA